MGYAVIVVAVLLSGRGAWSLPVFADMSHLLNENSTRWRPDVQKAPTLTDIVTPLNLSATFRANNLCIGEHVGTHMDSMNHVKPGGTWDISEIPLSRLTGPAVVLDIRHKMNPEDANYAVSTQDVLDHENKYGLIPNGAVVVLCSGWSEKASSQPSFWGNEAGDILVDDQPNHFPGFGLDAAKFLAENRSIVGLASDSGSADVGSSLHFEVHHYALSHEVWIIEAMANTCKIPQRGATIYAFPMKTQGGSGIPLRVVASFDDGDRMSNHAPVRIADCITLAAILSRCLSILSSTR